MTVPDTIIADINVRIVNNLCCGVFIENVRMYEGDQ